MCPRAMHCWCCLRSLCSSLELPAPRQLAFAWWTLLSPGRKASCPALQVLSRQLVLSSCRQMQPS